jgi:hypothetical protein
MLLVSILLAVPGISLAEGGQYPLKLKDGAEVRCMSGVLAGEFDESDFVGEYVMGSGDCVRIEGDGAGSGRLMLYADCLGLHCPLYRFNKYIYVYGSTPEPDAPVRGTVTFLSDGGHINQIILQHEARQALFPKRQ